MLAKRHCFEFTSCAYGVADNCIAASATSRQSCAVLPNCVMIRLYRLRSFPMIHRDARSKAAANHAQYSLSAQMSGVAYDYR